MIHFRQLAATPVLAAALLIGGCASADRPQDVPPSAAAVDEAKETVYWTATEDGRVWVVDDNSNKIIYSGEVRRGQTVRVDAKGNKVHVDNNVVTERDLVNDHRFKIFFERVALPPRTAAGETVITTDPNARTTVTTDPNAPAPQPAKTTVTTDPNAKTTVTTDPNAGTTTIKKE